MAVLKVERDGRKIGVSVEGSNEAKHLEVRLHSDANNAIIEYSDVSPHAPTSPRSQAAIVFDPEWAKREEAKRQSDKDLRFPVVDVVVTPEMEGVLKINCHEAGEYSFNGNFRPETHPVEPEIRVPADLLEHWENSVLLDPKSNTIESFYLAIGLPVSDARATFAFETLRDDWSGRICIHDADTQELIAEQLSKPSPGPSIVPPEVDSDSRLRDSLSWTLKYVLGCRNTKPDSPTSGGLHLLYDLAARTRLRSDWPWSWGPSANLLYGASSVAGLDLGVDEAALKQAGIAVAEATLKQRVDDPDHPAFGIMRTTNEPGSIHAHGFVNKASCSDTLYLAGWTWMPFYRNTGDERFLEASKLVVLAAERLMDQAEGGMLPQAFRMKEQTWIMNMFFETSMGLKGLAEVYRETGDDHHREIMIRVVERLLDTFQTEDGLWQAMQYGQTGTVSTCNFFTKSFGYIVEGLMAVHDVAPDRGYLERAEVIAEHIVGAQDLDGSWPVRWDRPAEEVGVSDKATSLWALLFLQLHKQTGKDQYRDTGMRALRWCMDNQYFGDDEAARGGIVGRSWPSGIIYRHWFDMITTYTMAWFGLALVEALALEGENGSQGK